MFNLMRSIVLLRSATIKIAKAWGITVHVNCAMTDSEIARVGVALSRT